MRTECSDRGSSTPNTLRETYSDSGECQKETIMMKFIVVSSVRPLRDIGKHIAGTTA